MMGMSLRCRTGAILVLALALILGGAASAATDDGVKRITKEDLSALLKKGKKAKVFVVDVRPPEAYRAGHIKGAVNIPYGEVEKRHKEFPKNKLIVTYCSWPNEHSSAGAALILKDKGITKTAALLGGFGDWQAAGLPVETSQ